MTEGPTPLSRTLVACPDPLRRHLSASSLRLVVTGAGGWLGRATLEMLDDVFADELPQRLVAFASTGREHRLRSGRTLRLAPLEALADLSPAPGGTAVAHYAFLTREKAADDTLDAYVAANRGITSLLAEQCRRLRVVGTFSTSSGAVYRADGSLETDLAANPYGFLKLEEEAAFARLGAETGSAAAICRVFNLAGPFINKEYALSSFLQAALAGRPLVIRARRPVVRSYAHVADVVAVGLAVATGLVQSRSAPYDTAGDEDVEVGTLAERIRRVLGLDDLAIERDEYLDRPEEGHRYVGDGRAFRELAAALGIRPAGLDRQIADTAAFLRDPG